MKILSKWSISYLEILRGKKTATEQPTDKRTDILALTCIEHQTEAKEETSDFYTYTEPRQKLPLCLSADIHKYENQD